MRRIHLDFVRRPPPGTPAQILLLLGAAALALVIGMHRLSLQPRLAERSAQLHDLQAALDACIETAPRFADADLETEWKRIAAVSQDLNQPWDELFDAFESAQDHPVALLSLAPDAGTHELNFTAEAHDYAAMLGFYRQLQSRKLFSRMALHMHQINRQDSERPVRFRVTARWAMTS